MGDGIQAAKAGILEIADVFVVNKADRDGADTVVRDLRSMLSLGDRRTDEGWRVPIVKTVASRGEGADEVVDEIEQHGAWLAESGRLEAAAAAPGRGRGRGDRADLAAGRPAWRRERSTAWRPAWSPGSSTPTPPPISCWRRRCLPST